MKWKGGKRSSNVDDRRSSSGRGMRGLPSMGTMMMVWPLVKPLLKTKFGWAVIGLGAAAYFSGFNPLSLVGMGGNSGKVANEVQDNEMSAFMSTTLGYTESVWNEILPKYGIRYKEPMMVLYRGGTQSGCGFADSAMGPFYCPADHKLYLDLSFFDKLAKRHDAPGDFAQAYVLAHEVGHHIQNMQGTLAKVQNSKGGGMFGSSKNDNALQVKVELQADCYAGVWAHHAQKKYGILEAGDLQEALRAASSIGDDVLQKEATGRVNPDGFTHGSAAQRMEWLKRGLSSGDMRECNTFR